MWEYKYQVPTIKINHRHIPLSGLRVFFSALPALGVPQGPVPSPQLDAPAASASVRETAVFVAGCFRGSRSDFKPARGVINITAGESGESALTSTHAHVSRETTGHAESLKVVFDPTRITDGSIAPHLLIRCP
jgi:peptide-methionine (S)-S-oxide reductase